MKGNNRGVGGPEFFSSEKQVFKTMNPAPMSLGHRCHFSSRHITQQVVGTKGNWLENGMCPYMGEVAWEAEHHRVSSEAGCG